MKNRIFLFFLLSVCFGLSKAQNSSLTRVLEYCPAPGQFVHRLPGYEEGDDAERMAARCLDSFLNKEVISLGGFGGYVTVGFDHTVLNVPGSKDILIWGNAFEGSAEPGVVMVSADTNGDGIPNDEWYELAGSEYEHPSAIHGYEITYSRPEKENTDVSWKDNQGRTGVIQYMGGTLYPRWITEKTLSFKGTCLPDNGKWNQEKGMWVMKTYDYGYADNYPNTDTEGCSLDIDWAVDSQGNKVVLDGIDFVRIYTGINQQIPTGGVGELSTEVCAVEDLHPAAANMESLSGQKTVISYRDGKLMVYNGCKGLMKLYNLQGNLLSEWVQDDRYAGISVCLPDGIYIIRSSGKSCKLVVR